MFARARIVNDPCVYSGRLYAKHVAADVGAEYTGRGAHDAYAGGTAISYDIRDLTVTDTITTGCTRT